MEPILCPASFNLATDSTTQSSVSHEARANMLELFKLKTLNAQELRSAVSDIQRFRGDVGELNHFLKGGDHLVARLAGKLGENLIEPADAEAIKASLICRIDRNILQVDEDNKWPEVKQRLKKAYGGGRWTPEEDTFQLFRTERSGRQSAGDYADNLLLQFHGLANKLSEKYNPEEAQRRLDFTALTSITEDTALE